MGPSRHPCFLSALGERLAYWNTLRIGTEFGKPDIPVGAGAASARGGSAPLGSCGAEVDAPSFQARGTSGALRSISGGVSRGSSLHAQTRVDAQKSETESA